MELTSINFAILLLGMAFCFQVGSIFRVVYKRVSTRPELLVFSLFNFSLAGILACRLSMLSNFSNRYLALSLFQLQGAFGCALAATFVHFTYLVTKHPIEKALSPRRIYPLAAFMAFLFFTPLVLHVAPVGTSPNNYDDNEVGPLFAVCAGLTMTCGMMPCYLLFSTLRKLRGLPSELVAGAPPDEENDVAELILLPRHLTLILRGTFVLMASLLIDLVWFLNPITNAPIHFTALGAIYLSVAAARALSDDIVRGERRKYYLEADAQARLKSLRDAQHQLKNQIAAIKLPLQTAVRGLERDRGREFQEVKLAEAIQETEELQETLDTMLNVARVEAGIPLYLGTKVPVDLTVLLEPLCQKRAEREATPKAIRYRVETVLPMPSIYLPTAVKQVFFNLIDNAFKYSPENSTISIQISVQETGRTVTVRICDQGKGVPVQDQERIFNEPFYRGAEDTRETPGTGLGLNLARRYVEAMAGKLWVESEGEGKGSAFVVTLPIETASITS